MRLTFITPFKIEFLLPFTGCRKVLGKMTATKYLMNYTLFYKQRFFPTSVLLSFCMKSTSDVAQVFLITNNHHHPETHFIFSIFVTMSRPISIMSYLSDPIFIFTMIFIIIDHIISLKQTHLFFAIFFKARIHWEIFLSEHLIKYSFRGIS